MSSKDKKKEQTLGEKYNLGKSRKSRIFIEKDRLLLQVVAEKCKHILKMGKLRMKT